LLLIHVIIAMIIVFHCQIILAVIIIAICVPSISIKHSFRHGLTSTEVSAAGVSTRRSAQFEGYAEVARATQLGRFRCMDAVDWPLDVKGWA